MNAVIMEDDLIRDLHHNKRYSVLEIAEIFGMNHSSIIKKMRKYKIEVIHRHKELKTDIEPELLWSLYHGNQYSQREIAIMIGCNRRTIEGIMRRFKIPARSLSEAFKLTVNLGRFCDGSTSWNKDKTAKDDSRILSGEKINTWKGGINELHRGIRNSVCNKIEQWRRQIFERDEYSCQICHNRCKSGNPVIIHAHHIKLFSNIVENNNISSKEEAMNCRELWSINNGITLCKDCHKWVHKLNPLNFQ